MAYTPIEVNAKESVIRSLTGTASWLNAIENSSPGMDDAEIDVGTNNITLIDALTPVTVANKTSTAVIADKGVSHTAACTTVFKACPIKFYDHEVARLTRLGTLQSELDKLYRKAADAVHAVVSTTLIDALSDGTISYTETLADGNTNFAAGTEAKQIDNMEKFGATFGEVCADNNGNLPDWIIAQTTAFGNLIGYSQNARGAQQAPSGPTQFILRGVPLWAQGNGTAGKWGAASKACVLMGTNRSLIYRLNRVAVGDQLIFETATHLWVLPIGITYTYCVDFTTTTGLARSVGEVINGVS